MSYYCKLFFIENYEHRGLGVEADSIIIILDLENMVPFRFIVCTLSALCKADSI